MTEHSTDKPSESRISRLPAKENVLQVERRDYVDLAPNDRPRVQYQHNRAAPLATRFPWQADVRCDFRMVCLASVQS